MNSSNVTNNSTEIGPDEYLAGQCLSEDFFDDDAKWPPFQMASRRTHYILGCILGVVGTLGILANTLVLFVFTRFRRLRGPFSTLIVNLAVGDLGTSFLHYMVVWSSFRGKWAFGQPGCRLYAMGVGFCGLMTIFTLSAIAAERYLVITAKPLSSWKMDHHTARKVCVVSWVYSCGLTLPPVLGWSRYVPEGILTSCSWDYTTRSPNNTSYYLFLLSMGFFLPVSIISYCYTFIVLTVVSHGKEMATVSTSPGLGAKESRIHSPQRTALRTAEVILTLVGVFLGAWSPYTVVTFMGQFGDRTLITPLVATLPAYFAKTSVLYNPIVYGLSHPHFRSTLRQYLRSCLGSATNSETREPVQRSSHHRHYKCFPKKGQDRGASTGCRSSGGHDRRYNSDYITTV